MEIFRNMALAANVALTSVNRNRIQRVLFLAPDGPDIFMEVEG